MRHIHIRATGIGIVALLAATVLLAACGGSSAGNTSGGTATATQDAQSIVAKTKTAVANIKDASFNVQLQSNGASSATAVNGNGAGKLTRNPDRVQMDLNGTFAGQQGTVSIITDQQTSSAYVQTAQTSGKWVKVPAATLGTTTDIGNFDLRNPTLVGEETINGQPTYHLRGTQTTTAPAATPGAGTATPATTTETTDVWVNKTTYDPVRIVTTAQDGSKVTIDFTGVNTGATIAVPSADQIISLNG